MNDEDVRFNVAMPERLRDDAKRNTERGELSEAVRELFRRKAYGADAGGSSTEIERVEAELRDVRQRIDELRHKRAKIETEIEAQETRATRLEEELTHLERERDDVEQSLDTLENMLHAGERMWPTRVKNAAGVEPSRADELFQRLKERNPDLPDAAFQEPSIHEPADWQEESG